MRPSARAAERGWPAERRAPHGRREQDRRFLEIATHAPVGIFMNAADGSCTYVNPACCELVGIPAEKMMGESWSLALHPDDRERVLDEWDEARRGRGVFDSEYRFCRSDGSVVWVHGKVAAIRAGDAVTGYIGTLSDITSRKLAEQAVLESQQRVRAVLDASPLAIVTLDPDCRVLGWNDGAERMFGWTEAEVLGRPCPSVSATEAAEVREMIRRVLSGVVVRSKPQYRRKKSGEIVLTAVSAAPLLDGGRSPAAVVAILDDITEREWMNEQLRTLLEDRERLMEDLHDNCIQSIFAIGLSLENGLELVEGDPARVRRLLSEAAANLNLVIQDLRSFISENANASIAPRGLRAEVDRIIESLGPGKPRFTVDIDEEAAATLRPDHARQLLQITREAISNVVRHARCREAGVSLQVRDGRHCLEIRDDGTGFDLAWGAAKGGLGLHHIGARVRRMGGRWQVVSTAGRGTRVLVELASPA